MTISSFDYETICFLRNVDVKLIILPFTRSQTPDTTWSVDYKIDWSLDAVSVLTVCPNVLHTISRPAT